MKSTILSELQQAQGVLAEFIGSEQNIRAIEQAASLMVESLNGGGKILSCGNGGSLCDSNHFAEELTGRYKRNRRPLAAFSMGEAAHITCTANDFGFEEIFSRMAEALGKPGDTLLAISTSGNSANIVRAARVAKEQGMRVVALTGKDGGELASIGDVNIQAPATPYSDRVQEIHIKVIHILVQLIEEAVFGRG